MVGNALARIVVSSEPMNTGSSTPSTTSIVSRCVRLLWLMGIPASMGNRWAYGPSWPMFDLACWIACQIANGVAGMAMSRMP